VPIGFAAKPFTNPKQEAAVLPQPLLYKVDLFAVENDDELKSE
jgi:hypothetical protein